MVDDATDLETLTDRVEAVLRSYRFRYGDEIGLQAGIALALERAGIVFTREKTLGKAGTIDFWIDGLGIEVKIRETPSNVTRQLFRYAKSPDIRRLLLVTTRSVHNCQPDEMQGKPVRTFVIGVL